MKNLIRKILKEETEDVIKDYSYERIASWLKPPYFKNMKDLALTDEEVEKVLSKVFGGEVEDYYKGYDDFAMHVRMKHPSCTYNKVYMEKSSGSWEKYEYNKNCDKIYEEHSDGYWEKYEFDSNGNKIYYKDSYGYWEDYEYDKDDNVLYHENSDGYWEKYEYDSNGNKIYYKDSYGYLQKYNKNGCLISIESSKGKWTKYKMDKRFDSCKPIYEERHTGYWIKRKFDKNGKLVYSETSTGKIKDRR